MSDFNDRMIFSEIDTLRERIQIVQKEREDALNVISKLQEWLVSAPVETGIHAGMSMKVATLAKLDELRKS